MIIRILKYTLRPYFKILDIFVLLNQCHLDIQTIIFQIRIPLFYYKLINGNFSENIDISISKFELIVFELFIFVSFSKDLVVLVCIKVIITI
jgi:hypothetical protein